MKCKTCKVKMIDKTKDNGLLKLLGLGYYTLLQCPKCKNVELVS